MLHYKLVFFFSLLILVLPSKTKPTSVDQDSILVIYSMAITAEDVDSLFLLGHKHIALPIRQCSMDSQKMLKSFHLSALDCHFPATSF